MFIRSFGSQIWVAEQAQSAFGLELGARMTVVQIPDDRLIVHSPIKPTAEIQAELNGLGEVAFVIAPNKLHHLYLNEFRAAFPNAKFYGSPGLEMKRRDFTFDAVIEKDGHYPWSESLQHIIVAGIPFYNETVFYHSPSQALILTDLAVNICTTSSLRTKLWLKLIGSYGKFGWSKLEKHFFVKDEISFRGSLQDILNWDFDKIIMAHGAPVNSGGKEYLKSAFM